MLHRGIHRGNNQKPRALGTKGETHPLINSSRLRTKCSGGKAPHLPIIRIGVNLRLLFEGSFCDQDVCHSCNNKGFESTFDPDHHIIKVQYDLLQICLA